MSKDLLAEVTRALRETEDASELEARATRSRVITGLHQTRVRRRTRLAFLLPIAATFLAASAWGAGSGHARRILQSIERWVSPPTTKAAPSIAARTASPALAKESALPLAPVSEPALALPLPLSPAPAPAAVPMPARARAPAVAPPLDPTLALYRSAHQAHFVAHDPVRALAAWDAYLSAAPQGQFAPEAKYNRALTLVRLGRTAEARAALEPFASALLDKLQE